VQVTSGRHLANNQGKDPPHISQIKNESVSVRDVNLGPPPGTLVLAAIMVSITCVSKPLRVGAIEWANLRHGPAKRRAVRLGGQLVQGHRCHVCDHAPGLPDNCHRRPQAPSEHPPAETELARWPQVETANASPGRGRQVHRGLIRSCREHTRAAVKTAS
jgi:hypothetical protein